MRQASTPSIRQDANRQESRSEYVLQVRGLEVVYDTPRGAARAVDDVSIAIRRGEVFGLAGESGCGKSTIVNAVMRLLKPPARIAKGAIDFDGVDVLSMNREALRRYRWQRVSLVPQSAMNALNPVLSLGGHFVDTLQAHRRMSAREARARGVELLRLVGIESSRLDSYPHELSGGMRQRAAIALALALNPDLIIMDEPTTALDVVMQREIMQEIQALRDRFGFSILFITHDLSLLMEFSTRIAIMYAGRLVELAPADKLYRTPQHPYSVGLLESFPSIDADNQHLTGIPGTPPDLIAPPRGCRFHPRCPHAMPVCRETEPSLVSMSEQRYVACHLFPSTAGSDRA